VNCEAKVAVAVARGYFGSPGRRTTAVGSGNQRTGDGTADNVASVCAVVNSRMRANW
jgi:hypothetical protein